MELLSLEPQLSTEFGHHKVHNTVPVEIWVHPHLAELDALCAVSSRYFDKEPCALELNWKLWLIVLRIEKNNVTGSQNSCNNDILGYWFQRGGCVCVKKVEPTNKIPERLLTHMYCLNFHFPKVQQGIFSNGNVEQLAISFKMYKIGSFNIIYIHGVHEIVIFISSNT